MTREFRERTRNWHVDGVREEVAALECEFAERTPFLFLMLNDQRRHMARHFEDIDQNRFEFHLPFFDADLVARIVRAPVQPFLRHALYHDWLQEPSPVAVTVPWQVYPDHVPCPVAFEGRLRYQWGDYFGKAEDRRLARKQGRDALRRLLTWNFPDHLISRARFARAILVSLAGSSAYGHVVRVGATFSRVWQQSQSASAISRDER